MYVALLFGRFLRLSKYITSDHACKALKFSHHEAIPFISSNYSFVESDLLQFHCFKILFTFCRPISGQVILISGRLYTKRGGEWYPENSGSRKFVIRSRNLGRVLNESRNLVFLCFFASRILEFLAAGSRRLGFLFVGQRFRSKP